MVFIVKKIHLKLISLYFLALLVAAVFLYLFYILYYHNLIYPGIKISGISVGGQSTIAAYQTISQNFQNRANQSLVFNYGNQEITFQSAEASPEVDLNPQITESYLYGRSGDYIKDLSHQAQALIYGLNLTPKVNFKNQEGFKAWVNKINKVIKKEPVDAQISLGDTATITPSKEGQELDEKAFLEQLKNYLNLTQEKFTYLPIKITQPQITTSDAQTYRQALENVKSSPLKLTYEKQTFIVDEQTLFYLLNFKVSSSFENSMIDKIKLGDYLKEISDKVNQPSQDARFTFDPTTKRVKEFQAAQLGKELDINQTATLLSQALTQNTSREITLPVKITQPKITTESVNNFGIKQLLGEGISNFAGSIDNRIFNIYLASSRLNGALVGPGETFSFNQMVGDISSATGYKQAYVIKSGRTVLDDGGGVCQVSTTLFRAIINSGLPVIQRVAHAYRVGYYEQGFPPGLDATVFAPSVDLKFQNDTPAYILVQAYVSGVSLHVDLYGSDDGRVTTLTTPKILNQTPPLPELRQDDPTLPKGTVKQVDWPAWGANVKFDRTVTRNGETIISETWTSNYRPWQAIYLVGTK